MRARVFNKDKNSYYISEVYGIANCGGDKYIVDGENGETLVIVPYLDFSDVYPYELLIECIDDNEKSETWIYVKEEDMNDFNLKITGSSDYYFYRGYDFIWKQQEALADLFVKGTIPKEKLVNKKIDTRASGWEYIQSQGDIDNLMERMCGFHDSVIREIHYISGDCVTPDGIMHLTNSCNKSIQLIFDSQWSKSIEIVFDAFKLLQLAPPGENYFADILDASVFIKDCMVYFYDSYIDEIPQDYDGTFIKSMGMRWREI